MIYVLVGGMRASLLADYIHTTCLFAIILTFMFSVLVALQPVPDQTLIWDFQLYHQRQNWLTSEDVRNAHRYREGDAGQWQRRGQLRDHAVKAWPHFRGYKHVRLIFGRSDEQLGAHSGPSQRRQLRDRLQRPRWSWYLELPACTNLTILT